MHHSTEHTEKMISEHVKREIDSATRFGQQAAEIVFRHDQYPSPSERERFLLGYWALICDYHRGVLQLLTSELFGSAFALLRTVTEVLIRAHVVLIASSEELASIVADEYRVNFKTIGKELDAKFELSGLMEDFLKSRLSLHSYTHSGVLQVGRRFDGHEIKPNYSDDEVIEVIRVTTSALCMVSHLITQHFGLRQDSAQIKRFFAEWCEHS
jgi:hypothetical protein